MLEILENSAIKKILIDMLRLEECLPLREQEELAWQRLEDKLEELTNKKDKKQTNLLSELEMKLFDLFDVGRDAFFQIGFSFGMQLAMDAQKIYNEIAKHNESDHNLGT